MSEQFHDLSVSDVGFETMHVVHTLSIVQTVDELYRVYISRAEFRGESVVAKPVLSLPATDVSLALYHFAERAVDGGYPYAVEDGKPMPVKDVFVKAVGDTIPDGVEDMWYFSCVSRLHEVSRLLLRDAGRAAKGEIHYGFPFTPSGSKHVSDRDDLFRDMVSAYDDYIDAKLALDETK